MSTRFSTTRTCSGWRVRIDIIPDFPYYEQVLTDYGPLVLSLFQSATNLLLGNLTLDQMRQTLTREIAHLEGLKLALEAEQAAAIRGSQIAETEQQMARHASWTFKIASGTRARSWRTGASTGVAC